MYERFTDRARKVMQLASQQAQRFNHEYIGTEHILLGLIEEGSGVAANVLKNLDIEPRNVRREIEKIIQSGPDMVSMGKLPQTPRAKKVIEYAIEEARNLRNNYVGTEHLLLGLVREDEGVAAQVLINLGASLPEIRAQVQQLLGIIPDEPVRHLPKRTAEPAPETPADLPPRTERAVYHLDAVVDLLTQMKEDAVSGQDFEWAATLRDQSDRLRKLKQLLLRERHREDKDRPDPDRS
jgi:ATP-dependent Clp protease ATP-binding subunit ClpA